MFVDDIDNYFMVEKALSENELDFICGGVSVGVKTM